MDEIYLNYLHVSNKFPAIIKAELAADNDKTLAAALASCRLASHVLYSLATPFFFFYTHTIDGYYWRLNRRKD